MPRCNVSTRSCRSAPVFNPLHLVSRAHQRSWKLQAAQPSNRSEDDGEFFRTSESVALPDNFCIIEDRSTVKDFASLQLDEIADGIQVRPAAPAVRPAALQA